MESKLTDSEFAKLQELKKSNSEIILTLGELNFQKTIIEFQIEEQSQKIKDLKKEESIVIASDVTEIAEIKFENFPRIHSGLFLKDY